MIFGSWSEEPDDDLGIYSCMTQEEFYARLEEERLARENSPFTPEVIERIGRQVAIDMTDIAIKVLTGRQP